MVRLVGAHGLLLCLGYRGETIKDYFLTYQEALSNDFVLSNGGRHVELLGRDIENWKITFVDTGLHSTIGQRLKLVEPYIGDDPTFLATYGDGLTDAPLDDMIGTLERDGKACISISVRPPLEYHVIKADEGGVVRSIDPLGTADVWINGGFFVFRRSIFDVIEEGDELVDRAVRAPHRPRRAGHGRYEGFWEPMDTIKDKQKLDGLLETQHAPWLASSRRRLMLSFDLLGATPGIRRVLAIGCHADDIEIGCGGTVLTVARKNQNLSVTWVVLTAEGVRADEARASDMPFSRAWTRPRSRNSRASASASFPTTAPR